MVIIEEQEQLRKLAFNLDSEIGNMGSIVSTLIDAQFLLGQLVLNMDEDVCKEQEGMYYYAYHRKLRVLGELIRYTMNDLNSNYTKVDKIRDKFLDIVLTSEMAGSQQGWKTKKPTHGKWVGKRIMRIKNHGKKIIT